MCCGRSTVPVVSVAAPAPDGKGAGPRFEYIGKTALTVVSPVTGKKYRFPQSGARVEVDARDRPWMTFVPNLKRSS